MFYKLQGTVGKNIKYSEMFSVISFKHQVTKINVMKIHLYKHF